MSRRAWVLGLAVVAGLACAATAQSLGGTWNTDIILDLTAGPWPAGVNIDTEITVEYVVGEWTFGSETDIEDGVWTNQDFDFAGVLGAYAISGDLEFEPDGSFRKRDWFADTWSVIVVGDRREPPSAAEIRRGALSWAVRKIGRAHV